MIPRKMISIVIPTYNRAYCLGRAIESVMAQTKQPDELIIVDDGSTDDTHEIVKQLTPKATFPIHLLRTTNKGAAAARNVGIRYASGDILCFLDSDDWWDKQKIEMQLEKMLGNPDTIISHTKEVWFRKGKRVNQKKKHTPGNGFIFSACLKMCVVGMSTVMVKRDFFDRYGLFDESLPCCEDYDLWLRAAHEQPFLLVDHALTLKEGGRADQLSVLHRMGMDRYRIQSLCNLLERDALSDKQYQKTLVELRRKCTIYGKGCIKHGREKEGRRYLSLQEKYEGSKMS